MLVQLYVLAAILPIFALSVSLQKRQVSVSENQRSHEVVELSEEQIVECGVTKGFIPDPIDCCHFLQCDPSNNNETAFRSLCTYPLIWKNEACIFDDGSNPDCNVSECSSPPILDSVCPLDNEIKSKYGPFACCVNGIVYMGNSSDAGSYQQHNLEDEDSTFGDMIDCPKGQIFNAADCCCEPTYTPIPECVGKDLYGPASTCCSYYQCFANRTGSWERSCMGGTVWNDVIKACDSPQQVKGPCREAICTNETFVPATCPENLPEDMCCQNGVRYTLNQNDSSRYNFIRADNTTDSGMCDREPKLFKIDTCSCASITEEVECDCLHWPFDEDFEDSFTHVSSRQDGVNIGPQTVFGTGAAEFSGNDLLSIRYFSGAWLGAEFTIALWFRATTISGSLLFNGDHGANSPSIDIGLEGSAANAAVRVDGVLYTVMLTPIDPNAYHHLAIVKADSSLMFYINGDLAYTESPVRGDYTPSDIPLQIGEGFTGSIDEFVVCTFGYSPGQIKELMDNNVITQKLNVTAS
ncbi:unnamed protein product [Owenia fusiformis]|uniref:Chitin-binding type-2 domain-containing protein n=1 Tax=Owenia fusiformis TaxID=6347 RepID=A0A8S4NZC0_OWEFU|nr:unnamed protein product [Owenia fusiformis]